MRRDNVIEQGMCYVLDEWYRRALEDYRSSPNAIVYLRTSPNTAYARVQMRARGEESSVSARYIHEIHNLHEEWIDSVHSNNLLHEEPVLPVYTIDADQPLLKLYLDYERCLSDLRMLSM
ncbi:deoxynucleoside kinase-like [Bradysia coprophila]|uniref:deoxynucleoside kinase-like n=1 Tax=Bradysia coprophila TaxID=38358 RepID=UPI00187D8BA7|nr:deoxynucleoside kinase-like [Bradysia coprophila]